MSKTSSNNIIMDQHKTKEYITGNIHIHRPPPLKKKTIFEKARIKGTMETLKQNGMPINDNKLPFIIERTMPSGRKVNIKEGDLI